jgi:exonuclease III
MYWLNLICSLTISLIALTSASDTQCPLVPSLENFQIGSPQGGVQGSLQRMVPMPTSSSDRRPNKNTFRLMQYNVEWLFTDYYSNAKCPGSGCPWSNSSQATTHMNYVSQVISSLDPDFINLCEVEGCDELNQLTKIVGSEYLPYLIQGTDSATGQNVGIITKIDPVVNLYRDESRYTYPIPGSKCGYTGSSGTSGISKHYITELKLNGLNVAVLGLHLLAYPTDTTRCAEREAQAMVAQEIIIKYLNLGYEIVVLGDLNDYDGQVLDANDSIPTSQVLQILKTDGKLVTASSWIPQDTRYTNWWDKDGSCKSSSDEFTMIDHILITPGLSKKITGAFVYHGYQEFCGTYNSDHYPVIVDFDFSS